MIMSLCPKIEQIGTLFVYSNHFICVERKQRFSYEKVGLNGSKVVYLPEDVLLEADDFLEHLEEVGVDDVPFLSEETPEAVAAPLA